MTPPVVNELIESCSPDLDLDKYCEVMEEVKRRVEVVYSFLSGTQHALYEATTVECIGLQIRKILELIAMGSLVANVESLAIARNSLNKRWHADRILKEIERANPDFYPRPIIEFPGVGPIKSRWEDRTGDVLTREEFNEVYGRCGSILHAENPLGTSIDYGKFREEAPNWMSRIVNLLNSHTIRLAGNPNLYLIHMQENGTERVRGYVFAPLK